MKANKLISVFEHQSLKQSNKELTEKQLIALQKFYGEKGVPYYSLTHKGVKFNEYVGVIQVGNTIIEVLPKADKHGGADSWRRVLIGMLHAVGIFDIHAPSSSSLQLKANSILDLYFELFVKELEYLVRRGLIKKYRKEEGNARALKGSLQFSKHIRENLVHKERFYIRQTVYDKEHQLHQILYKALKLLFRINTNSRLSSRLGNLLLDFPELTDIKISESTFDRIVLDRKTEVYSKALEIARLILLNYHPDLSKGNNDVLALMFDMNVLWEQFVYASLRKHRNKETKITAQNTKAFWKPIKGSRSNMRPDIVLNKDQDDCVVLDTKWKNLGGQTPSSNDLRQMYVYMRYYNAKKVALVYPGQTNRPTSGKYFDELSGDISEQECSLIPIPVIRNIMDWQNRISDIVKGWTDLGSD